MIIDGYSVLSDTEHTCLEEKNSRHYGVFKEGKSMQLCLSSVGKGGKNVIISSG